MSDVFVSYKAQDRRRIRPLVEALQAHGYSIWWDEQIGGGAAWRHTIEAELNAAKCVIVVWSKHSVGPEGEFVQDEAARAKERHVYVPVTIDKVHVPLGFGETQALSLVGWHGNRDDPRFHAVLAAVHRNLGGGAPLVGSTNSLPKVDRRTIIATGAVATVAIIGVGVWTFLKTSSAGASADSIAVLPFENLSGDPGQAYFSDGIAEELRNALSRIPDLKVVARTSSEAVRNDDVKTAARKLDVATVLTGSVRRSPSTIRVNAQLVDGRTGLERWSQSFDRPLGDALTIESNIAQNVADALSIQLGHAENAALTLGGTRNSTAHDLFLKADPGRASDTEEGLQRAIASLDAAIELDPNYAEAYARKAMALDVYAATYAKSTNEMLAGYAEATAAARKAISLAPRLPVGHAALALVLKNELRFKPSFAELKFAAALPGKDAVTLRNYAGFLAQLGRFNQASNVASEVEAIDPLSPGTFELRAFILYLGHQFGPAIARGERSLQLGPERARARSVVANALLMAGRAAEAESEYEKLPPTDVHRLMGMAAIAGLSGDRTRSDAIIEQIRALFGDNASYQYAQVYAQRHEADRAIESLRKAVEVRDPGLPNVKVDPFLDPVRNDGRIGDIVRQLDFPA